MNPAYVALIGSLAAAVASLILPFIIKRLSRSNDRADVASTYQSIADGAAEEYREIRKEMRAIRAAVETLARAVERVLPGVEVTDPDDAADLREALSEVRQVL